MAIKVSMRDRRSFTKFKYKGISESIINKKYFSKVQFGLYYMPKKARRRMLKKFSFFQNRVSSVYFSEIFDTWELVATSFGTLSENCLETLRRQLRRKFGKLVLVKLNVVASINIYEKANHSRMGKGKGAKFVKKVAFVRPGTSILELRGLRQQFDKNFFFKKLNVATRWVCLSKV